MAYKTFLGTVAERFNRNGKYSVLPFEPIFHAKRNLSNYCTEFIRNSCENLFFENGECFDNIDKLDDISKIPLKDYKENIVKDVDRLCLERAIYKFAISGSKEDAFNVYLAFCEIFKPFGTNYSNSSVLLEVLAEHEMNASSLMMKHRDHYSHSVYVFMIGIAVFSQNKDIRNAFYDKYSPEEKDIRKKNAEFLKLWGVTSLFHDIGYPFEIAHQQVQGFFDKMRFHSKSLFVSYRSWNHDNELKEPSKEGAVEFFSFSPSETEYLDGYDERYGNDMNRYLSAQLYDRLKEHYCDKNKDSESVMQEICEMLEKRSSDSPMYMDHAYFSSVILLKTMLANKKRMDSSDMDILIAIMIHNSMFRFYFNRGVNRPLNMNDGQPLAYLLMLCDELQCWDRIAYGQNTRSEISPWDFDLTFHEGKIRAVYYYDESLFEKTLSSKYYNNMISNSESDSDTKSYKFVDDIARIVDLGSNHTMLRVQPVFAFKKRQTGHFLSDTTYMDLYSLAIVLNGRYDGEITVEYYMGDNERTFSIDLSVDNIDVLYRRDSEESKKISEALITRLEENFEKLSLELKLSNVEQAKAFASHLEKIKCFYTSRNVDYELLSAFTKEEIEQLAFWEHERWMEEKAEMGWLYGRFYLMKKDVNGERPDNIGELVKLYDDMKEKRREVTVGEGYDVRMMCRHHKDIVPISKLTEKDIEKDIEPLRCLLKLLNIIEGIQIYRR